MHPTGGSIFRAKLRPICNGGLCKKTPRESLPFSPNVFALSSRVLAMRYQATRLVAMFHRSEGFKFGWGLQRCLERGLEGSRGSQLNRAEHYRAALAIYQHWVCLEGRCCRGPKETNRANCAEARMGSPNVRSE